MSCALECRCSPERMGGVGCVTGDDEESGLLGGRAHNTENPHTKSFGLYVSIRFDIRLLGMRSSRSNKQGPCSELPRIQLFSWYEQVSFKGGAYPETGAGNEHSAQQARASVDYLVVLSLSALEKASDPFT